MTRSKIRTSGAEGLTLSSTDITVASGDLLFGTADKGVVLGVTSNTAANTLDDYEEGTWTPVYAPTSNSFTSVTYESSTFGTYTKVGRQVTLVATMKLDNLSVGSASGNLVVSGIPFTALDSSSSYSGSVSQQDDWNEFPTQIFVRDDDTLGLGYKHADGDDQYSVIEVGDMDTSGGAGNVDNRMRFTVTYFTA
tara:strand:+ start:566 stop:1147 length:582 start_codon:yes stop_codon:yes gene_type:complete